MPQSVHSGGSGSSNHHRYVHVILLNKTTLVVPVESKNTKVLDIFNRACEHVELRETEFFGLAQLKDNEFQFLQQDLKISKLASKIWRLKNQEQEEPLQTFYLRVQYYVDSIGLLKEKATRLQYYFQLRDNLLHYSQVVSEEKCFLLAAYALQADHGNYVPSRHDNGYFDPREYFPASVVMRRGQDYITTHLPAMHKSLDGMLPTEARVNYIVELSTPPVTHNFHFYKMRKRKYDTSAVAWVAISPKGLGIYEETDEFRCLVSVFLWPDIGKLHCEKKKFEIISEGAASRKYTFYTDCKEWAEYIVSLCCQVHQFHLKMQPRLAELQHLDAHEQRYREMYVYSENIEAAFDRQQPSMRPVAMEDQSLATAHKQPVGSASDNQWNNPSTGLVDGNTDASQAEIFITSPPRLTTGGSLLYDLPQLLQSYGNDAESRRPELQRGNELSQRRLLKAFEDEGKGRNVREFSDGDPRLEGISSSVPASSTESLAMFPFTKADSIRKDHPQLLLLANPSAGSNAPSLAPSARTTPSQCSTSPNSSAGSSQLPLSLLTSRDVYDAALLRQSLPHGVHFNEYLQSVWSGRETAANSESTPRKSSLDFFQLHQNRLTEPVQRSTSLRQPLVERSESGKNAKLSSLAAWSKVPHGLSIARSNSDKTPKSSRLTLLPDFLNGPAVGRSDSGKSQKSSLSLHSDQGAMTRADSNKGQKSVFALHSEQPTVTRSDSNKSQKAAFSLRSDQATVTLGDSNRNQKPTAFSLLSEKTTVTPATVTRSDSGKSQKSAFALPSDVLLNQLGATESDHPLEGLRRKEDLQLVSGLVYPIMPVEAQIQKLVFGPTMTAVSTPVRPNPERQVGNIPSASYHPLLAYIPDSYSASGILQQAGILSTPYQDLGLAAGPSDASYQGRNEGSGVGMKTKPLFPPPPADFVPSQSLAMQTKEDGGLESHFDKRGSPPPYGAVHSTITSAPFHGPVTMQPQQMTLAQLQQLAVTQLQQSATPQLSQVAGMHVPLASAPHLPAAAVAAHHPTRLASNGTGGQAGPLQSATTLDSKQGTRETSYTDQPRRSNNTKGFMDVAPVPTTLAQTAPDQNGRGRKNEVMRHVSDRYPGYHDPQCPRHGLSSDIREKLRSLGSSVPPMLNALLTDKSLHDSRCTCADNRSEKRVSSSHSSDALNIPGTSTQQKNWNTDHKLRYFPDLSFENDATMIINGTMSLNGALDLDEADEYDKVSQASAATSPKVQSGTKIKVPHHSSSDSLQHPLPTRQVLSNHNHSNSDSATQNNAVSSEC